MRTLGEIAHAKCKISLFSWNGKFLIKFEQGLCEQIYKVEHLEVENEAVLRESINEEFISKVISRFEDMHAARLQLF